MTNNISASINFIVGIAIMLICWQFLRRKFAEDPGQQVLGLNYKTLRLLFFIGIGIQMLLLAATLFGVIKPKS